MRKKSREGKGYIVDNPQIFLLYIRCTLLLEGQSHDSNRSFVAGVGDGWAPVAQPPPTSGSGVGGNGKQGREVDQRGNTGKLNQPSPTQSQVACNTFCFEKKKRLDGKMAYFFVLVQAEWTDWPRNVCVGRSTGTELCSYLAQWR